MWRSLRERVCMEIFTLLPKWSKRTKNTQNPERFERPSMVSLKWDFQFKISTSFIHLGQREARLSKDLLNFQSPKFFFTRHCTSTGSVTLKEAIKIPEIALGFCKNVKMGSIAEKKTYQKMKKRKIPEWISEWLLLHANSLPCRNAVLSYNLTPYLFKQLE